MPHKLIYAMAFASAELYLIAFNVQKSAGNGRNLCASANVSSIHVYVRANYIPANGKWVICEIREGGGVALGNASKWKMWGPQTPSCNG